MFLMTMSQGDDEFSFCRRILCDGKAIEDGGAAFGLKGGGERAVIGGLGAGAGGDDVIDDGGGDDLRVDMLEVFDDGGALAGGFGVGVFIEGYFEFLAPVGVGLGRGLDRDG